MKKTPWFQANINPVNIGLYECRRREFGYMNTRMLFWNGEHWEFVAEATPYGCHPGRCAIMVIEDGDKWRGLMEPLE